MKTFTEVFGKAHAYDEYTWRKALTPDIKTSAEYKAWLANWKIEHREIVAQIREAKKSRKEYLKTYSKNSQGQRFFYTKSENPDYQPYANNTRQDLREKSRTMQMKRFFAKEKAREIWQNEKVDEAA